VHVVGTAARCGRCPRLHADEQDLDPVDGRFGDGAKPYRHPLDVRERSLPDPHHTASPHVDGVSAHVGCSWDYVRSPDASRLRATGDES
jgi:hypothetical protein